MAWLAQLMGGVHTQRSRVFNFHLLLRCHQGGKGNEDECPSGQQHQRFVNCGKEVT